MVLNQVIVLKNGVDRRSVLKKIAHLSTKRPSYDVTHEWDLAINGFAGTCIECCDGTSWHHFDSLPLMPHHASPHFASRHLESRITSIHFPSCLITPHLTSVNLDGGG